MGRSWRAAAHAQSEELYSTENSQDEHAELEPEVILLIVEMKFELWHLL